MIELHLGNSDCLIFGHLEQIAELFCKYLLIFRQVCFGFFAQIYTQDVLYYI